MLWWASGPIIIRDDWHLKRLRVIIASVEKSSLVAIMIASTRSLLAFMRRSTSCCIFFFTDGFEVRVVLIAELLNVIAIFLRAL